eukprot:gnl/TRDRNA2_/TRDRNA2_143322_c1_seq1.p1 gnl/TRDRNA2_/TRDRNA2_143322_c1~~gnl/TRDRNA2_/TRDRNA2_143322_c1_seq1.p1  ORF type:complete len:160 (+),score=31.81 gnl/TRDRNA2_/TRDRNA2_143322_c1_seq1:131-610(+)
MPEKVVEEETTPPNTARHRLDSEEDQDSVSEAGDVEPTISISSEQYNRVLQTVKDEHAARKELEKEVDSLKRSQRGLLPSGLATRGVLERLDKALVREEASRTGLIQCMDALSEEWSRLGLPSGDKANSQWGHIAPGSWRPRRQAGGDSKAESPIAAAA